MSVELILKLKNLWLLLMGYELKLIFSWLRFHEKYNNLRGLNEGKNNDFCFK